MLIDRFAGAFSCHFNQAKWRDVTDFTAVFVGLEGGFQGHFHLAAVCGIVHIDEIKNKNATHVAQAKLPGYLIDGFKVGLNDGVGQTFSFSTKLA